MLLHSLLVKLLTLIRCQIEKRPGSCCLPLVACRWLLGSCPSGKTAEALQSMEARESCVGLTVGASSGALPLGCGGIGPWW